VGEKVCGGNHFGYECSSVEFGDLELIAGVKMRYGKEILGFL
jgi:hypothetical protein